MKIQKVTGFSDASPLLDGPPAALRRQALREGFLFFKGLLPPDEVLALRGDFLAILARHGLLDPSAAPMDGIGDAKAIAQISAEELAAYGVGVPPAVYREVQCLPRFHRLAHHPNLLALFEALFDEPVLVHPRNIARLMLPSAHNVPTPPHQDYIHIQGTPNVWTCWFPVGDAPLELGNLSMLAGSHRQGLLRVRAAAGAGGFSVELPKTADLEWVQGDYAAGDVVIFHSHTVHQSLPNQLGRRIRLSCDYRYQPVAEPVHISSLEVHCAAVTWDEIYAQWPAGDEPLQGYWETMSLNLAPWDDSIRTGSY